MTKTPSVIVLDLDDTLYRYDSAHSRGMSKVAQVVQSELNVEPADFESKYEFSRSYVKSQLGQTAAGHSRLLYFKRLLETLGLHNRLDLAHQLESAYWSEFTMTMRIEPSSLRFLQLARGQGIPVILATDLTTGIQIRKVMQLEIHPFIFGMLTSEEVGVDKPATEFGVELQRRFDFDFSRGWVIGDSLERDGGLANQMNSLFLQCPTGKSRGHFFDTLCKRLEGK